MICSKFQLQNEQKYIMIVYILYMDNKQHSIFKWSLNYFSHIIKKDVSSPWRKNKSVKITKCIYIHVYRIWISNIQSNGQNLY